MTNVLAPPPPAIQEKDLDLWRQLQQMYGLLTGESDWGAPISHTSYDSDGDFAQTTRNLGTGGHQEWKKSTDASRVVAITDAGLTTPLAITSTLATGTAPFTVASTTMVANLNAEYVGGQNLAGLDTRYVNVTGDTMSGALVVNANLTTTASFAAGDANADAHTVIGVTTFRNTTPATQLYVDAGNNRVIVGSSTALGSDTTPNLQVVGRLYVAPDGGGNDQSLFLRHNTGAVGQFTLGATNSATPDLIFKNNAGTQVSRVTTGGVFLAGSSTTAPAPVGDGAVVATDLAAVSGANYRLIYANGSSLQITENAGTGVHLTLDEDGIVTTHGLVLDTESLVVGTNRFEVDSTGLGFFGSAPIAKPTVVGSKGGNAALDSLLDELANLGLITDLTT